MDVFSAFVYMHNANPPEVGLYLWNLFGFAVVLPQGVQCESFGTTQRFTFVFLSLHVASCSAVAECAM